MQELKLDWCSHEAATYAVRRWHYSRTMTNSKLVRIGVWEQGRFVGAILFGCGANRHLARPFGLDATEACELVRVALAGGRSHPTSQCLGRSLKMLRSQSPGLRLIVSYADSGQGHRGTIYQATNWIYLGETHQSYLQVKRTIVPAHSVRSLRPGRAEPRLAPRACRSTSRADPHAAQAQVRLSPRPQDPPFSPTPISTLSEART